MRLSSRVVLLALLCMPTWVLGDVQTLKADTSLRAVHFLPDNETDLVTVAMIVLAGEVDFDGPEGLSHYLEHLMFWHADNVRGEAIHAREGNAWVNGLVTTYYNRGEITEFEDMIQFAQRLLTPPELDKAFMIGERNVVAREYDFRVLENPDWRALSDVRKLLYDNHPVSRSVIGTPESIASLTIQHAYSFHKQFYNAANSILLVSGNLSPEQLIAKVESAFPSASEKGGKIAEAHTQDWRNSGVAGTLDTSIEFEEKQAKSSRFIHASLSDWSSERGAIQDEYTLQFAQRLLESALPGSLAKPLRLDNFIISSYELSVITLLDKQVELSLFAWPDDGVSIESASDRLTMALKTIADEGVPVKSFERVKKRWLQTAKREGADMNATLWRAWHHISLGLTPTTQSDHLRLIESVSLSELNSLITALGSPNRKVVGLIKGE